MHPRHRKRMQRFEVPRQARFLTFSCHRRLALFGTDALRTVFVEALVQARLDHRFCLYAWVLMPEHAHLLITPDPNHTDVAVITRAIKQPVAQRIIHRWRRLDAPILSKLGASDGRTRFWQAGGGFDRNVRGEDEFLREFDYIHANPVSRGLVASGRDWRWSSARWYLGLEDTPELDADQRLIAWARARMEHRDSAQRDADMADPSP